ncbi:hypothetical protein [Luteimonas kalidii]|uniref:DUF2178 domain-containing protein n=1 Tax=Luteimonas kalidii TaxID=3042025 RepID=A0ABT6JNZ1_9GAMM|nr:hypothetical protein [Luteimonas kalidii]MDH5832352.1 hypothetical protein [Luteimonas kalidii]
MPSPISHPDRPARRRVRASGVMFAAAALIAGAGIALPVLVPGTPRAVAAILVSAGLILLALALAWREGTLDGCEAASPALRRRYMRGLMGSMAAYVAILFASVWLLRQIDAAPLRVAVALAPVVPIGFAVRAMVRFIRDLDEMQQRIELESIAIATLTVSMLYMTGGLLQQAQLLQVSGGVAMIWVFPLVCFTYGLAKAFVMRRYR